MADASSPLPPVALDALFPLGRVGVTHRLDCVILLLVMSLVGSSLRIKLSCEHVQGIGRCPDLMDDRARLRGKPADERDEASDHDLFDDGSAYVDAAVGVAIQDSHSIPSCSKLKCGPSFKCAK